jgi:cob(I)alamin adenosyltransferase
LRKGIEVRIHKVYTRTGDQGLTGLSGGKRVPKESLRVEAYGTVDELQAQLGMLRVALSECQENRPLCSDLVGLVHTVQNDLFDLGSALATPPEHLDRVRHPVTEDRIRLLEEHMDRWTADLSPLSSFVLSGGGSFSALAQVARTVCRRAERVAWRLSREEEVPPEILKYLNRLSDFLFVMGRYLAQVFDEEEPLWETPLKGR